MAILVDSYSETNEDSGGTLLTQGRGQTFTGNGTVLHSAILRLYRIGNPTGTLQARIYSHTGTYGVDGVPTGVILAYSDTIDTSSIPVFPTIGSITLTFSGANRIVLENGTNYCIMLPVFGQNSSNTIGVRWDQSSPTHAGTYFRLLSGTFTAVNTIDLCFYVYGNPIIAAEQGSFTTTGVAALFALARKISVSVSGLVMSGVDAIFRYSNIFTNKTKNATTFTNKTKNATTFANISKNSTTFTNKTKNASTFTNLTKNSTTFTNKEKS